MGKKTRKLQTQYFVVLKKFDEPFEPNEGESTEKTVKVKALDAHHARTKVKFDPNKFGISRVYPARSKKSPAADGAETPVGSRRQRGFNR